MGHAALRVLAVQDEADTVACLVPRLDIYGVHATVTPDGPTILRQVPLGQADVVLGSVHCCALRKPRYRSCTSFDAAVGVRSMARAENPGDGAR